MPRGPKVPLTASLLALEPSWMRSLRAENKSPRTLEGYHKSLQHFCRWLSPDGDARHCTTRVGEVDREMLEAYFGQMYQESSENSVLTRHIALRVFFEFCIEYDELGANPMRWIKRPMPALKDIPVLTDEQIRRLLSTCERGKSFNDKRDYAILRTFLSTGTRIAELCALRLVDVALDAGIVHVDRGKGGAGRPVAIGARTAKAIDQYIHLRERHRLAHYPGLWLSQQGQLSIKRCRAMVTERARAAGLEGVHPHAFRHWFSHGYLAAGGQESSLKTLAGWKSSKMLERYGRSMAKERAIAEHHSLGIGEKW
jgi:site-specific recombinase XerD